MTVTYWQNLGFHYEKSVSVKQILVSAKYLTKKQREIIDWDRTVLKSYFIFSFKVAAYYSSTWTLLHQWLRQQWLWCLSNDCYLYYVLLQLIHDTTQKKCTNLFLRYLFHKTLNIPTCIDPQGTIIRESNLSNTV